VFLLALIPDVDIILPGVEHRTVTHSLLGATILFLPFFATSRTKAVPYFAALIQHSLLGDFLTGGTYGQGTMLLWPATTQGYGLAVGILNPANILIEWTSFLVAMIILLKTGDVQKLFHGRLLHLTLIVPTATVFLPPFLQYPLAVPAALLIPHLAYLILFALAILSILNTTRRHPA
jgi:membrane-bound metal-dependent hydrolase YbcI (DUF457 family)